MSNLHNSLLLIILHVYYVGYAMPQQIISNILADTNQALAIDDESITLVNLALQRSEFLCDFDGNGEDDIISTDSSNARVILILNQKKRIVLQGLTKEWGAALLLSFNSSELNVLIGAPEENSIYCIFGGNRSWLLEDSVDVSNEWIKLNGKIFQAPQSEFGGFGRAIWNIGDINGDGINEIVVGDKTYTQGFLLWLKTVQSLPSTVEGKTVLTSQQITKIAWTDSTGGIFQQLGDINGDGYADFAGGFPLKAEVVIIWGNIKEEFDTFWKESNLATYNFPISKAIAIRNDINSSQSYFGSAIAAGGDLNNDGYEDLLIGDWRQATLTCIYGSSIAAYQLNSVSDDHIENNTLILATLLKNSLALNLRNPNIQSTFSYFITTLPNKDNDENTRFLVGSHGEHAIYLIRGDSIQKAQGIWQNLDFTCLKDDSADSAFGLEAKVSITTGNIKISDPSKQKMYVLPESSYIESKNLFILSLTKPLLI